MSRVGHSVYGCLVLGCFWTLEVEIPWADFSMSPPLLERTSTMEHMRARVEEAERQCLEHAQTHTVQQWTATIANLHGRLERLERLLHQNLDAEHRAKVWAERKHTIPKDIGGSGG